MEDIIVKGGEVIDPASGRHDILDILIQDGKISKIQKSIDMRDASVVDAQGMIVSPGLIDLHVHLCDPGFTRREDIQSGSRSAAAGGFTTIVAMPNTDPVLDNPAMIYYVLAKSKETACVRVLPTAAITKGMKGEEISPIGSLKAAGAVMLSNDNHPIAEAEVMRRAMAFNRNFGLPFCLHCEEPSLSRGGLLRNGNTSVRLGVKGIPDTAETTMMSRDILLAESTGTKLHVNHIGSRAAVDLIRMAKEKGLDVTCDVTPYHFSLVDSEITDYDPDLKFFPPIGNIMDVQAIKAGLQDGAVDIIASDHSPWTPEEKNVDFDQAPFGAVGLEVAFPLSYTELVLKGTLDLGGMLRKLTVNPARVLGLPMGRLVVGSDADISVFNLNAEWIVEPENLLSLSSNTPLRGRTLRGKAHLTIARGRVVMKEGEIQEGVFPLSRGDR